MILALTLDVGRTDGLPPPIASVGLNQRSPTSSPPTTSPPSRSNKTTNAVSKRQNVKHRRLRLRRLPTTTKRTRMNMKMAKMIQSSGRRERERKKRPY
jgi:hypothetical protein